MGNVLAQLGVAVSSVDSYLTCISILISLGQVLQINFNLFVGGNCALNLGEVILQLGHFGGVDVESA